MTFPEYSAANLVEIADLVTKLVNPRNHFSAQIWYAEQEDVFYYSDSTPAKKEQIIGSPEQPLSFGDLIEYFQDKLHELGTSRGGGCPAQFCFCKYDTETIRDHDLFWELLYLFAKRMTPIEGDELGSMVRSYGLEYLRQYIQTPVDMVLFEGIVHLAEICLETLEPSQLFTEDLFEDCINEDHRYAVETRDWQSKSILSPYQGIPLYVVDSRQCLCGLEIFVPKLVKTSPSSFEGSSHVVVTTVMWGHSRGSFPAYEPLNSKEFPELWMAIKEIFRRVLPNGQARVMGKIQAGVRLTSTERNTKRQLRSKLRQIDELLELWEDLDELIE